MVHQVKSTFWRNKQVLVTGCSGFLGSWLTQSLVEKGATVAGLIRDVNPDSQLYRTHLDQRIIQILGDLTNYLLLERILNEYEIEVVFHLAAQPIVETANWSPLSTFESNIRGTWNLLEASRRSRHLKHFIIASSDKAYGGQVHLPYIESLPLAAVHPYDVSKCCADFLALSYYQTFSLPVVILRSANFYGAGDLNFNRLIPGTIRSIFFGERPRIRSNGLLTRDYLYIEDAAAAFLMVAEKMVQPGIAGNVFNISFELQLTAIQVVKAISAVMQSHLKPIIEDRASNEIHHQYLSCEKVRTRLGWQPKFTFTTGLKKTISWYRQYFRQ